MTWSIEDEAYLAMFYREGKRDKDYTEELAYALDRTKQAIEYKYRMMKKKGIIQYYKDNYYNLESIDENIVYNRTRETEYTEEENEIIYDIVKNNIDKPERKLVKTIKEFVDREEKSILYKVRNVKYKIRIDNLS